MIPQWLIQHTGIDFTKLLVTTAVGDNDYFDRIRNIMPKTNYLTHHVVFSDQSGVLEKIELDPAMKKYVTNIIYHKKCGEKVNRRINGTDYIAYVTMEFPNKATQLSYSRDKIEELISPIVRE